MSISCTSKTVLPEGLCLNERILFAARHQICTCPRTRQAVIQGTSRLGGWRRAPQPRNFSPLTEAWQWFIYETLCESNNQAFESIYYNERALNNGHGVDVLHNYITGERADLEDPAIGSAFFSGVLSGIEDGSDLIVDTFDGRLPPPLGVTPETHPWLFSYAVTVYRFPAPHVAKFPQLDGRDVRTPILSKFPVRYPLARLEKLAPGAPLPSPYYD
jgi:hypothetical protein